VAEKRKPTYDLVAIQSAFTTPAGLRHPERRRTRLRRGGHHRDNPDRATQPFLQIDDRLRDHRIWQDVYHVPSPQGLLYVKFTADALAQFLLLSFKARDHD